MTRWQQRHGTMRAVERYGSFLVRLCRHDNEPRVDVEHIRSGATLRGSSLAVAMAWMNARADATERPPREDQKRSLRDGSPHPG